MRAFRPSRYAPVENLEEDHQSAKDVNVEVYAKRAEAGIPLFEPTPAVQMTPRSAQLVGRD